MKILAIETSCDETAIALIEAEDGLKNPRFKILENLVASQIKIHRPFGGIVPTLAKREHIKNLPILFNKIFRTSISGSPASRILTANFRKSDFLNVDLIAVTVGPGLEPALWTGINFAKKLHSEIRKLGGKEIKIIGISHLDGHLYSFLLNYKFYFLNSKSLFPAIALIVSGGHTILLLMNNLTHYKKLGETRDDAAGECFDKAARLLKLPYPGGPEIEKLAKRGNPKAVKFPRPMIDQKNYDFSFSGLKTSVLYFLRDNKKAKKADIAASFQAAAFDVLIYKTLHAAKEYKAKSIMLSGGVAANKTLKKEFRKAIKKQALTTDCQLLTTKYPTDNAAMVAAAAYINYLRRKNRKLVANGNLSI